MRPWLNLEMSSTISIIVLKDFGAFLPRVYIENEVYSFGVSVKVIFYIGKSTTQKLIFVPSYT